MAAGDIRRTPKLAPKAELRLPMVLRGTEPIFQYLMDTAANSERLAGEYVELARQLLEELKGLRADVRSLLPLAGPSPTEAEPLQDPPA